MDHDEEFWKKELERFSVVKRCPKCHSLALGFDHNANKLRCTKCGYEMNMEKTQG